MYVKRSGSMRIVPGLFEINVLGGSRVSPACNIQLHFSLYGSFLSIRPDVRVVESVRKTCGKSSVSSTHSRSICSIRKAFEKLFAIARVAYEKLSYIVHLHTCMKTYTSNELIETA